MIVLGDENLPEFIASLAGDFPASLNIYYLAKHHLTKRYNWPGITFVLDRFPDFGACVARTGEEDPSQGVPPFINGYTIFVHARDPAKLMNLLDEPGVIDWNRRIAFFNVERPIYQQIIEQKCRSLGGEVAYSAYSDLFVEKAFFVGFSLKDISCKYTLPEGYSVGPLLERHTEQVTREKHYGDLAKNLLFMRYLLQNNFPSAGLFDDKGELIAFIIQRPEGVIGAGYVTPDHRGKGYFKVVCYELLKEIERQGDTLGFADITAGNAASTAAMRSIGGFVYPNYECCWFEYIPKELPA